MIGALTLSILNFVHTLISLIYFSKLYSVANPGQLRPLPLENYIHIVTPTLDLQRVSFYSIIDFLYHSFATKLIISLVLIKGPYSSSMAIYL